MLNDLREIEKPNSQKIPITQPVGQSVKGHSQPMSRNGSGALPQIDEEIQTPSSSVKKG